MFYLGRGGRGRYDGWANRLLGLVPVGPFGKIGAGLSPGALPAGPLYPIGRRARGLGTGMMAGAAVNTVGFDTSPTQMLPSIAIKNCIRSI